MHQINDDKSFGISNKIKSILKNGFSISNYSTLCGTARLLGSSKVINAENILDYRYYENHSDILICIIAIPKFIEFNGKKIEYSSFEGESNHDISHNLRKAYGDIVKYIPDAHHRKCSLFDAVKGFEELPKSYFLGILNLNYENDTFEFINPKSHLIFKSEEENQLHKYKIVEKLVAIYDKYQTSDMAKVIVKSYKDEENVRFAENDFDILMIKKF